jgi:hypothetical protein
VINLMHKAKSPRRALCVIGLSIPGGPGHGVRVLSFPHTNPTQPPRAIDRKTLVGASG